VPGEPLSAGESQLGLSAKCADSAPVVADRVVVLIVPERAGPAELRAAERGIPAGAEPASPAAADTGRASATAPGEHPPAGAGTSAGERAIIVAIPRDVTKPGEVMQAPAAPPGSVTVGSIDYDDRGQVVVSGKAVPDSVLQVYLDNRIVGQAQAGPDGNWRLTPDMAIPPGKYTLRVDQVTVQGKVVARAEIPFLRGEPLADLPAGRIVVIQPGDYLWKIARASYGSGTRYTLIFEANRGQISDPDLIYPGQVFTLPRVN
jgi:nucleoid-associated protein YgaU